MRRDSERPAIKKGPPGPNGRKWVSLHHKYGAVSTHAFPFVWDIKKPAVGPFCTDPDGNVFMDFNCNVASSPFGYNHPEIISAMKEAGFVDPVKMAGQDFYLATGKDPHNSLEIVANLQERIIKISKPLGFKRVFLSNSGAEAVENAIKLCYARGGSYAFTFLGGFHGRTLGALSLNRSKAVHRRGYPSISKVVELPFCKCKTHCVCGWRIYKKELGREVTALEEMIDNDVGKIDPREGAFIIIEPVQGEGGYNIGNKEFMADLSKLAKKHKIPIIADEVQSGVARTGKWWASEHFDFEPSIISAAKALRVGATIGKDEMFPNEQSRISSTWGAGDIYNSIVACKTLEIIEKHNLLKNAEKMGSYYIKRLKELGEKYPEKIVEVRGLGLMDAVEFSSKDERDKIEIECFKQGLITLGCGYRTLRLLPPLDVRERELDISVEILGAAIKKV